MQAERGDLGLQLQPAMATFALLFASSLSLNVLSPPARPALLSARASLARVSAPIACVPSGPERPAARLPASRSMLPAAAALAGMLLLPGAASATSIGDSAFVQASSLIFVSELGDKTFFIAALLAARASKLLTFAGCAGALALMTAISVVIGQVFHGLPESVTRGLPIDDYVAIASFLYFGVKSILDALAVEEDGAGIAEEREDAEKTLEESGIAAGGWPLVVEACTLTIAAEVGDRSQLATIALSAAANPFGVFLGGTAGHCLATGMAVLGGSFISKYLSERVIGLIGGFLFLAFALSTAVPLFLA